MENNQFISNKKIIDINPGDKNIDIKVILIQFISKNRLKNDLQITQYLHVHVHHSIV
jgi:hypothetical protein